ncbi:MAG: hypothetical protein A9181_01135 [Dehalococcoides mccartyi]|nr:MAG: hypothetical protein A9181_01135 [Dehalococcoides mccartyi]
MRNLITGPLGTVILFIFILVGIGLIIAATTNDQRILWTPLGIVFLFLAAGIRILKQLLKPEVHR